MGTAIAGAPRLTVVIPMRDVQSYVGDMLLTLRRNTAPDIEFLAVDDGSRDDTPRLLAESGVPGLTVLTNPSPLGLSGARNTGLDAARGEYVTFLDGDDWVAPGYFTALADTIEGLGCDFVRVDHIQVTGRRHVLHRAPMGRRGKVLDPRDAILPVHDRSMVDYPYAWAGVYRRSLGELLRFHDRLHTAEDRPWIWRLHREAATYAVASLAGVFYRRAVAGSLTRIGDARQLHFFDAFDLVLSDLESDPEAEKLRRKAVRTYCALIAHHLTERDRLTPALRRELRRRARKTVEGFPPDALAEALPGLGADRRDLFADLLGIDA
ncbi:glycosyltransferase involved in cell wall biosynthesis [Actinocorallia herbida]|uniref:Glycosyltransferase involved in cell wall biosynthesis n=1 Tax=Actinocorallia herbida TaxID=58109 RepID=A0A3N1D932_9ACTN|nr:glycosyltransferase family 2 protein [Actinocorallia herbida]ROO90052.1 glycosyltransferase involved in cell wall biosynthesis [Actinocorallia herbida]